MGTIQGSVAGASGATTTGRGLNHPRSAWAAWRRWQTRRLVRALREETTCEPGWRFRSAIALGADPNGNDGLAGCRSAARARLGEPAVLARARRLLAAGADPHHRCAGTPPFVMSVIFLGHLATFDLLLQHGAEPLVEHGGFGSLHQARHVAMLDRLLALGADLDAPSCNGTVLQMAEQEVKRLRQAPRAHHDPEKHRLAIGMLDHLRRLHRQALVDAVASVVPDPGMHDGDEAQRPGSGLGRPRRRL